MKLVVFKGHIQYTWKFIDTHVNLHITFNENNPKLILISTWQD